MQQKELVHSRKCRRSQLATNKTSENVFMVLWKCRRISLQLQVKEESVCVMQLVSRVNCFKLEDLMFLGVLSLDIVGLCTVQNEFVNWNNAGWYQSQESTSEFHSNASSCRDFLKHQILRQKVKSDRETKGQRRHNEGGVMLRQSAEHSPSSRTKAVSQQEEQL